MLNIELEALSLAKAAMRKYISSTEDVDWEQRRYEIAKEASIGLLKAYWTDDSCGISQFVNDNFEDGTFESPDAAIACVAVDYAEALIEELKKCE